MSEVFRTYSTEVFIAREPNQHTRQQCRPAALAHDGATRDSGRVTIGAGMRHPSRTPRAQG